MNPDSKFRLESDLLGERQIPADKLYGVQTLRGIENFQISRFRLDQYPLFINGLAYTKWGAAIANHAHGLLTDEQYKTIVATCKEILEGKHHDQFPVDMFQGGAGTSVNMNTNEVIANRALEILGFEKGDYVHCYPNDHVNGSQSTNDSYPTAIKLAVFNMNKKLVKHVQALADAFRKKGKEFADVIKMGRTQLQDAVPMTLGQEFEAYAVSLEAEIATLNKTANSLLEINMGGTAIGTGLNAPHGYAKLCTENLAKATGEAFVLSHDLVEATPDTSAYVFYSSGLKKFAVKLSKICNDLRLLASGPRAGLSEINLPAMQPGSSIMPGKVNPVIPEVTNQTCFKVIGNDTTIMIAAEAGQLQLNVMEPIITECLIEDLTWLPNAMDTLREKCIDGITVNKERCLEMVKHSIGIVTALNPYIGYKNSTKIAKEALETGGSVYDLVLKHNILSKEKLDAILSPEHMLHSEEHIK